MRLIKMQDGTYINWDAVIVISRDSSFIELELPDRVVPVALFEADGTTPTPLGTQMIREIIIAGGEPEPDEV
jgi:hypothetical protein